MRNRFLRQLYYSYIFIVILSALVFAGISFRSLTAIKMDEADHFIKKIASSLSILASNINYEQPKNLFDSIDRISNESGLVILLLSEQGDILKRAPTDKLPPAHHKFIPDIKNALEGRPTCFISRDRATITSCSYPVSFSNNVRGVIRVGQEIALSEIAWQSVSRIAIAALLLLLIGLLLTLWFSRRLTYPFQYLQEGAERYAKGDLDFRLFAPASDEIGRLARVLNKMAAQLQERIKIISRNKNELDVVLASMKEGIIAINSDERVIKINQSACSMLDTTQARSNDKSIEEVLKNINLQNFAKKALRETIPLEDDIILHERGEEIMVKVYSRELLDGDGKKMGVLVALNDITQIKRLENIRRDFVANVSHELKTPVTSIKGFVETLLDGAINQPEEAKRFLGIIKRQIDRLNEIFDDLLSLARLEEDEKSNQVVEKQIVSAISIASSVVQACNLKAQDKAIEIIQECSEDIKVRLNPSLAEQAIINLVDNAIKYGNQGSKIILSVRQQNSSVVFDVIDQGPGIQAVHIDRIFERFYRVDTGRSRQHGGTGLGLAIVKHIAILHGGNVSVKSEYGKGSIFSIAFPN